jgi:hypothetical protein
MVMIVVQAAVPCEQVREPDHLVVVERRAAIDQALGLPGECVHDSLWRVAEGVHRPALDEVEVAAAVGVDEP